MEFTNQMYPSVLKSNPLLAFKLKVRFSLLRWRANLVRCLQLHASVVQRVSSLHLRANVLGAWLMRRPCERGTRMIQSQAHPIALLA